MEEHPLPRPLPHHDPEAVARITTHYELEIALADRLRESRRDERQQLYNEVYDELFRTITWHVQHTRAANETDRQLRRLEVFLRPWLSAETTVLEIGAGDGRMSRRLAPMVKQAHALDVSEGVFDRTDCPANMDFVLSDGIGIPLADDSVDFAFSNQLLEHLHPDDVQLHLAEVQRVIRPGGTYLVITPNRLNGPHDVSGYFSDVAQGFHLREYTCGELAGELRRAGFHDIRSAIKVKRRFWRPPVAMAATLERVLELLPRNLQRTLASRAPVVQLVSVRLAARCPG